MDFSLRSRDYVEYIKRAYELIHSRGDYITELDSATGDGDHWTNINMGFESLVQQADRLEEMKLSEQFREIGRIMMSVIGGSSGILYGSAYIAASRPLEGKERIGEETLYEVLLSMLDAIISRGQAKEGDKTMIDSLAPAVKKYKECLDRQEDAELLCEKVKKAAEEGAENTKKMEAVRGRASYQADRGLGHLDPGAVTMSYQLVTLMDFAAEKSREK